MLRGIDLSVAPHEVICLIGASGSGKSTLLRCVNLLEPVNRGRILLWGQDVTAPGVDENAVRRHIGIVFQSFNLFPHMTVLRNITLGPTRVLGLSREEAEEAGRALLERFGLSEKTGRLPRPALRRSAAAGRDRPGPRDAAGDHAARRGHERARPRARVRGARA